MINAPGSAIDSSLAAKKKQLFSAKLENNSKQKRSPKWRPFCLG
jgi:hypothetical protein